MGSLNITLFQIYYWIYQWNDFYNRSTYDKVSKSWILVAYFFYWIYVTAGN